MQQKRWFDAFYFTKASEIKNTNKASQIGLKRVIASLHEAFLSFLLVQN